MPVRIAIINKSTNNKSSLDREVGRIFIIIYNVCPVDIQPCNMKNRDIYWRRYKKHCTQDNDASVPFKVGTLGPHTDLPASSPWSKHCKILCWNRHQLCSRIFLNFIYVWNLFPFKDDFSLGKSQKSQGAKSGLEVSWVTWVIWYFTKKFCMRRDA